MLRFALPGVLERLLLTADPDDVSRMASDAKRALMHSITVYVDGRPVRLKYERWRGRVTDAIPEDSSTTDGLRLSLSAREQRTAGGFGSRRRPRPQSAGWTHDSAMELISRLRQGHHDIQLRVIRRAVANHGEVSRNEIYEVANFGPERTLRGLASPTNRITTDFIEEGLLADGTPRALQPVYVAGGRATAYEVPADLARILAPWASSL